MNIRDFNSSKFQEKLMQHSRDIKTDLDAFINIIPIKYSQEELDKCILRCAGQIITALRLNYDRKFAKQIPANYQKNKIMNFDIIDYLKLNIITDELLKINISLAPCGYLYKYFNGFNKLYTTPTVQEFIKLFTPYRSKMFKDYQDTYRFINNKLIADYFGKHEDTYDLLHIDDKIGDTTQLTSNTRVDVGDREQLFVYINNEWQIANDNQAYHSDLIAEYLMKATHNDIYDELGGEKIYTADDIPIISDDDIAKQIESKPLFFGSIQGKIGYLASAKNINKQAAAEMIKSKFNVKKVYFQQQKQYKYTRLAKLI